MAKKDTCLAVLKGEPTHRFVHPEDCHMIFTPGERNMGGEVQPNNTILGKDWFDCTWVAPVVGSPLNGATIAPDGCPCDDLEELVRFVPTPEQVRSFDWQGWAEESLRGFDPEEQILQCRSMTGFFERLHCLVGFEDALCSFYEDPESVEAFFAAMVEYKKAVVDCVCQVCKPDIMIFDDDYGTARATFIDPKMWREFFPQYWKPLVEHVHSKGVKFELHSCGYITPLVGDFVDLGMDILQPLQTNNDLKGIKEQYGDKIVLRLAVFDKQMSSVQQTEEEIRAEQRSWYATLAPGGNFLPELVPIDDPYYAILRETQYSFEQEFYHL
jgi:uroporphyrinogen decarboxylase